MNIGCHSDFMDKIIERADKRQERMEKMINKMLDKSEPILNAGKPKPMTNDEWRRTCSTEEFAEFLFIIGEDNWLTDISNRDEIVPHEKDVVEWLKEIHK